MAERVTKIVRLQLYCLLCFFVTYLDGITDTTAHVNLFAKLYSLSNLENYTTLLLCFMRQLLCRIFQVFPLFGTTVRMNREIQIADFAAQ